MTLVAKFDKCEVWTCPLSSLVANMICELIWFCIWSNESIGLTLVAKMRFWSICAYKVDKWKNWNDFVSKLFGFLFGKMKVLEWICRENEILVYLPTTLINGKFELVPWCETWYVNLFGFVFGKMKVLVCPLSRKRDFSLYGYNFDKYEG